MPSKTTSILLRLSSKENVLLDTKAKFLGITKSELLRRGIASVDISSPNIVQDLLSRYASSDDKTKSLIVDLLAEFYTESGYPHNRLTDQQKIREMEKISKTKSPLLDDNFLQINTVGLSLCNFFHPHMVKVQCGNTRTPYEQFSNKDLLKDAIKRWMDLGKRPVPSGLRRILRIRDGVKSVVNFKPAIAKYFYDTYCPKNGKVLDPCSGYSGRLAGCIAANKGISYHGIDPDGRTAVGNMQMAATFIDQFDIMGRVWKFDFRFDMACAEDVMPGINDKYDLVFSSPPFFRVEKYSNAPNQSWIRYPSYGNWRDGFLFVLIKESWRLLRDNCCLILNLKNYKKEPIADDAIRIARDMGFELIKTYQQKMPNSEYNLKSKDDPKFKESITWHSEPIFVFKKRS